MKPNFALNLSHEGISLLHRAKAGWLPIGDVQLDAPNLNEQMSVLRQTATDLDHGGLTCKLIIPNSQILYTDVVAPGPSPIDRERQIRESLVGLTPYPPEELVFDWRDHGDHLQVAVVAQQTLNEAEAFAADFKFNPVSFVGIAQGDKFDGEPFFGMARAADSLLAQGDAVEPDEAGIEIVGGATNGSASIARAAHSIAVPEVEPAIVPPLPTLPSAIGNDHNEGPPPALAFVPESPAKSPAKSAPDASTSASWTRPNGATRNGAVANGAANFGAANTGAALNGHAPEGTPENAPGEAAPVAFASRRANGAAPLPPAPAPAPAFERRASVADYSALDIDDVPDMPAWRDLNDPSHANGMPDGFDDATLPVTAAITADPQPATPPPLPNGADGRNGFPLALRNGERTRTRHDRKATIAASTQEAKAMTVFGARSEPVVGGKPKYLGVALMILLLLAFGVAALWSTIFMDTASNNDVDQFAALPAPVIEPALPDQSGTGSATPLPTTEDEAVGTALAPALEPALAPEALPSPSVEPEVDTELASVTPTETPTPEVVQPVLPDTPAPDRVSEPPPSPAEAERRYVTTGIWQLDPQALAQPAGAGQLGTVQVAGIDPTLDPLRFSGLPGGTPDVRPVSLTPPARLRASFDLDERGLVAATPEGNLSPDGTLVFLGNPPVTPGIRPGTPLPVALASPSATGPDATPETTPETAATLGAETLAALGVAPETTRAPDTSLALVPAIEGETTATPETGPETPAVTASLDPDAALPTPETPSLETAALAPETPLSPDTPPALTPEQEELRQFRPQARPGSLDSTGEVTSEPDADAPPALVQSELALIRPTLRPPSIQEEVASDETPNPSQEDTEASEFAIAASGLPSARPAAVTRRAAEALAAASRAAEERRATAEAEPEREPEREVEVAAVVTPSIPSTASVSRAATEQNAIKLSKINLIGVYGSPSDRRALIRLKSGRYVKVEVGDRVDGGRVAAIGDNELRYVKGGRNITLKMPRG